MAASERQLRKHWATMRKRLGLEPPVTEGQLLAAVQTMRERPLLVLPTAMEAASACGWWFPLEDLDLVLVDEAASGPRRTAIIGHELGHMLLGHAPREVGSIPQWGLEKLRADFNLLPSSLLQGAAGLARSSYENGEEAEAERYGMMLFGQISDGERQLADQQADPMLAQLRDTLGCG